MEGLKAMLEVSKSFEDSVVIGMPHFMLRIRKYQLLLS